MPFQLTSRSLIETAQTGAAFAELFAPTILAASEDKRPAMIESASAHLRNSIAVCTNALRTAGADDYQIREINDAAEFAFSDRLVELLHPTTTKKEQTREL